MYMHTKHTLLSSYRPPFIFLHISFSFDGCCFSFSVQLSAIFHFLSLLACKYKCTSLGEHVYLCLHNLTGCQFYPLKCCLGTTNNRNGKCFPLLVKRSVRARVRQAAENPKSHFLNSGGVLPADKLY